MAKLKVYLICPVRNVEPRQAEEIRRYVQEMEAGGKYEFHFPPRDVDQSNDDGGVRICQQHMEAMAGCDAVHVWWDDSSKGSHYDLGMAAMLRHLAKQQGRNVAVVVANCTTTVQEKSFQNVLVALAQEPVPPPDFDRDSGNLFLDFLQDTAMEDAVGLERAFQAYGPSWKSRGGIGAFMMLARKWDRLENRLKKCGWDIFRAIVEDTRGEGVIDDVRDLRRYLLLVESEMRARGFRTRDHRDNKANAVVNYTGAAPRISIDPEAIRREMETLLRSDQENV
jgi:hypothetical protein